MEFNIGNVEKFNVDDFLRREFKCECGKIHEVNLESVIIEEGAIFKLPCVLESLHYNRVFMVADQNTYDVAGPEVEKALQSAGFTIKTFVYKRGDDLVPDELAIGEFLTSYYRDAEVIVTVGSGVLNDIVKYMSFMLDIPSIVVATAPSMDGYASDTSALIVKNTKVSLRSTPPKVIIGDLNILKEAPMDMIVAGLGDMLGKYSALRDWKLANIVVGEYYCEVVKSMVESSLKKCVEDIELIGSRDGKAIGNLMEGLVVVGIAMSFIGNSRPASGAEHHISHFWELDFLVKGKKAIFHGTKVGIATLIVNSMAEVLIGMDIDFEGIVKNIGQFDQDKWKQDMRRVYKKAAPEIISLNEKSTHILIEERRARVERVRDNWGAIVHAIEEMPSASYIEELFKIACETAPIRPRNVGIDDCMVCDAILYAKELRQRYTILQLLWDIGMLEQFASMGIFHN